MEFCLVVLYIGLIGIEGYYQKSSFSTRDISECKTIYMCPTFCWKLEKGCFICKCEDSTTEYMEKAITKMKEDYKPIHQTGNQYTLGQTQHGGNPQGTWSSLSNSNTFPGMGSLSGAYSFGGDSQSSMLGDSMPNRLRVMPQYNSFSKPQYSTFFQNSEQMLPGQCPLMDYSCPSACWMTDSNTGCIKCLCTVEKVIPTTMEAITVLPTTKPTLKAKPETRTKEAPKTTPSVIKHKACTPIETCPNHCLSFDRKTYCALCQCPTTTTEKTTTTMTTTTTAPVFVCQPPPISCPQECLTYDPITFCSACLCSTTTTPTTTPSTITTPPFIQTSATPLSNIIITSNESRLIESCESLPADCPTRCVKLRLDGCPVCHCPDVTTSADSGNTRGNSTDGLKCPGIKRDCPHNCITYDPKTYCPLCLCPIVSNQAQLEQH